MCYFGPGNTLKWMTDDVKMSATYAQFIQILGFFGTGHQIHSEHPEHKPKGIDECIYIVKRPSLLTDEEKEYPLNEVSIFRSPYFILYQCLLRLLYPKKGDRSRAHSYCIDFMVCMHEEPIVSIDTAHYIWHEIRLASFLQSRIFPHAPYIQALIGHTAQFHIVKMVEHKTWRPPAHTSEVATAKGKAPI